MVVSNPAVKIRENQAFDGPRHKNQEDITSSSSGAPAEHVQWMLRRISTEADRKNCGSHQSPNCDCRRRHLLAVHLYRAVARDVDDERLGPAGLRAYVSPDGIHWTKLGDDPVFTQGAFDSQNVAFWSPDQQRYLCYFRVMNKGMRSIAHTTSKDFLHWTDPVVMEANQPGEHVLDERRARRAAHQNDVVQLVCPDACPRIRR